MNGRLNNSDYVDHDPRARVSAKSMLSLSKHINRMHRANKSVYIRTRKDRKKLDLPPNDFDPESVENGLHHIDMELHDLEQFMPEEVYEVDDFDVDDMLLANQKLREKIKDIVIVVKEAISRAAAFKRNVVTHRAPPTDPEVKGKRKEIKAYQSQISQCSKYINNLHVKIDSMDDPERMEKHSSKLNKLNRDMRKLEAHKAKLQKQYDNQLQTMHTLYSDPELKEKVTKMTEKIAKMKAHHEQLTKEHKEDLKEQKKTLDEYARMNAKKRALVNKKIAIKNNVPSKEYFKKEYELQQEYEAMKKRHEDFQQLLINQVSSHPICTLNHCYVGNQTNR